MIGSINTVYGSPCFLCGEPITWAWTLHEVVRETQWEIICETCELATEIGEGK